MPRSMPQGVMNEKTRQQLPGRPAFCIIIILLMMIAPAVSAGMPDGKDVTVPAVPVSPEPGYQDMLANATIPFVANEGQLDKQVRYSADTFYGTGYITGTGITHRIRGGDNTTLVLTEEFIDPEGRVIPLHPAGEEQADTVISYFTGNDSAKWQTRLPVYNVVSLGELYPGITVKLRAHGGTIEKILYVSPGVRPETVRIRVRGADRMHINGEGKLVMLSSLAGNVSMTRPVAYQESRDRRDPVESRYILSGNTYGYTAGDYDTTRHLVIDPALDYSTYLGGTDSDIGHGIAVDGSGNAYITGYTASTDFPITTGAYQTLNRGSDDVFVTKLNAGGTDLVYSTYLGGTDSDIGYNIAVDGSGNAYITGETGSADFPTTAGAFNRTYGGSGSNDGFVTKLNAAGTALLYSTYLGGTYTDAGWGIAVDGSGNAYVTGRTHSADFPVTTGAYQIPYGGLSDVFVTKLNAGGTALLYSTYLGGADSDAGWGIAVDGSGNAYITGQTGSADFPTTAGAFNRSYAGGLTDVFVTKLNAAGTALLYSTYLGGTGNDAGRDIAVDGSGNAYVTGNIYSADFPTTAGAFQTVYGGGLEDVFVTKLNAGGTALVYSTYLGGTGNDAGSGIAVDSSGNAYITGYTGSADFPITAGAFQTVYGGGFLGSFITKLNAAGTALLYSTYLGGTTIDIGQDIAVDGSGNAYITGYTGSADFPTTAGAFDRSYGGGGWYDVFAVRSPMLPLPLLTSISPASGSTAGGTSVTITGTGFNGATDVLFGATAGTSLTVVSDTTITIISPAHTTGTVDVTVTTPIGTSAVVVADQFTYGPLPTARFTGTPTTGTAPLAVTFTDASDNTGGTLWNWSFGDTTWDNRTISANPVHTYASAGTYTVSLTVTNASGSNTLTRAGYITVTAPTTPATTPTTTTAATVPTYSPQDSGDTLSDFPSSDFPLMTVTVNIGGDSKAWQAIVTGTKLSDLIVTGTVQSHGSGGNFTAPPGIVFQYISLAPARYNTITNAVINFTVPQSWLDENHIAPGSILLYHQTANGWEALPTRGLSTKDGTVYFSAVSPGFSLFAIAGTPAVLNPPAVAATQQTVSTPAVQEQVPAPAAVAKAPVTSQTTAPPAPSPVPAGSSSFPVVPALIILCCVGLIGGGWYAFRWWNRRQNPALFREYD
jgi:large repetitive protein